MATSTQALHSNNHQKERMHPSIPNIDLSKIDNVPYYIEKEYIRRLADEYNYEEVPVDDYYDDPEDTFDNVVNKTIDASKENVMLSNVPRAEVTMKPEIIDDFIRNFLLKLDMKDTLNCFQNEWYEHVQGGKIKSDELVSVPSIYISNQELNDMVKFLQHEVERYKTAAEKAKEEYIKMKKERDYHRMNHNRVAQEKNKLINDLKRLKSHYESYEPLLRTMKAKYDTAIREKVINQLERDRAITEITSIKKNENDKGNSKLLRSTQKQLQEVRNYEKSVKELKKPKSTDELTQSSHPNDSEFPSDNGFNPYLTRLKNESHLLNTLRLSQTIQAHNLPISSISIHPRKMIAVTTSDDKTWKMWTIPDGQMIMRGEGHTDWVAGSDFHPSGKLLATCSGDSTVKIWNFEKEKCVHTFTDHLQAVWSVSWHSCGNFLVSGSIDNTAKIWDINSLRCRQTLRGHADSVNSTQFLMFSNTILTGSADKTLSLWDARTGLVAHTFYGHLNSVNEASFNLKGDMIVSCDASGIVKLWDVRKVSLIESHDFGPNGINSVAFNATSNLIVTASDDSFLKILNLTTQQITSLSGHEDAVHCARFDLNANYLLSGGCDNTMRVWS